MKVAFFVHCFFPQHFYGTETYTKYLAKFYQAAGHEVVVVSAIFQGEPAAESVVSRYDHQGIPVVCIDKNKIQHSRVRETYYQPDMRSVLEQILLEIRPDLIHVTHLINHTAALLEVTRRLDIPTYATFTDFFGFCLNNKLEAANGNLCRGPSKSRVNCVACHLKDAARNLNSPRWMRSATTPQSAQGMAQIANLARHLPGLRGGVADRMVEDIRQRPGALLDLYNAVYKGAIAPTRFLQAAYVSNGLSVPMAQICFGVDIDRKSKPERSSEHRPVVAFIGQIAPHKGTDLLLQAFQRLPRGSAELRIYGSTDQDPGYMQVLKNIDVTAIAHFMGTFAAEHMADIFQDIDLLVIPSQWYENSPLVLLNALATHTPVLVSDVPGMTEFLDEGQNGFAFERANVDDLSSQLARILSDPEGLYGLSHTTNYARTTQSMAEETFSIYHSIS